jgi:hypothetical protein
MVDTYSGGGACCASSVAEALSWYPWIKLRTP